MSASGKDSSNNFHGVSDDEDMSYMLDYGTSPIRDEDYNDNHGGCQGEEYKNNSSLVDSSFDSSTSHIDRAIDALNSSVDSDGGEIKEDDTGKTTSINDNGDQVVKDLENVPLQKNVPLQEEEEISETSFPAESVLREEVNIATKLEKGYGEMQWLANRITEYRRKKDVMKAEVERLTKIATSLNNNNTATISRYIRHNHPHQNMYVDKDLMAAEQRAHRAKEKLRANEELNRKYKKQNLKILLDTKHIYIKKIKEEKSLNQLRNENVQIEDNIQQKLDEYSQLEDRLAQLQQDFQDEQDREADFYSRNERVARILAEEENTVSRCRNNEEKWRKRSDDAHHDLNKILLRIADAQAELMAENARVDQAKQELITIEGECDMERMELQTIHNSCEKRRKIDEKRLYQLAQDEYIRYYDTIPKKQDIQEIVDEMNNEFLRFSSSTDCQEVRNIVETEGVKEEKLQVIIKNVDSRNLGEEQICSSPQSEESDYSSDSGEEHISDNEEVRKGKLENPDQYKQMVNKGRRCMTCSHKLRQNEQTTDPCKVKECLVKAHSECWRKLNVFVRSKRYKDKALHECADRHEHEMEFVDTKNVERTKFDCVVCEGKGIKKSGLVKCKACKLTSHYRCWRWTIYAVVNHNEYHYCGYRHMVEELGNSLDDVLNGVHCRPIHMSESDEKALKFYEEEPEKEKDDSTSTKNLAPLEKEVSEELLKLGGNNNNVLAEKVSSKNSGEEQICSSLESKERANSVDSICSSLKNKEQANPIIPGEEQICSSRKDEENQEKAQEVKDRVAELEKQLLATNYEERNEDHVRVNIDFDALVVQYDNLRDMAKRCTCVHKAELTKWKKRRIQENKDAFKVKVEMGCQICATPISPWSKSTDIRECRCCQRQVHKACWATCAFNAKEDYDVEVDEVLGTFCSFTCRHIFLRLGSETKEVDYKDLDKKILGDIPVIMQQYPEPQDGRYTKYLLHPGQKRCVLCLKEADDKYVSTCINCSRQVHCNCYLSYITVDTEVDQPFGKDDPRAIFCSVMCRAIHNQKGKEKLSYEELDTIFHDHNQRYLEVSLILERELTMEDFMWQIKWAHIIMLEHEELTNEYMTMIREHADMLKAQEAEEEEWKAKEEEARVKDLKARCRKGSRKKKGRNMKLKSKKEKKENPGEEQI